MVEEGVVSYDEFAYMGRIGPTFYLSVVPQLREFIVDLLEGGAYKEDVFYKKLGELGGLLGDTWRYLHDYVETDEEWEEADEGDLVSVISELGESYEKLLDAYDSLFEGTSSRVNKLGDRFIGLERKLDSA